MASAFWEECAVNKYHNKKSNGFDSIRERKRYYELLLLERAGKIQRLKRQVRFELIPAQYKDGKCVERRCDYVADFTYWQDNKFVVEDCKGFKTDVYKIKKKLMLWRYDIRIKET